jgi:hypothetical protein
VAPAGTATRASADATAASGNFMTSPFSLTLSADESIK